MSKTLSKSLCILGMVLASSLASCGENQPIRDCDRLAAWTPDPQRTAPGVDFDDIDSSKAVAACREAVSVEPIPRLEFQYARSLLKAENYAEALRWYHKAVEKDYPAAMYGLGMMDLNGQGVPQSDAEAARWFRLAAEKGIAQAMTALGAMYFNGRGVPQSDREAVRWYRQAAEKGSADGMSNLGFMYQNGKGVPQSNAEAVRWYRQAADKGDADGMTNLGMAYRDGLGVTQSDAEALRWLRMAANKGNAVAMDAIGVMYQYGQGVPQSNVEALRWYRQAADKGDADAESDVSKMSQRLQQKPEYFRSRDFKFAARFCGAVQQSDEWDGYGSESVHTFMFSAFCPDHLVATAVTVADPGSMYWATTDSINDALVAYLEGYENSSSYRAVNREFINFRNHPAIEFFTTGKDDNGVLVCGVNIAVAVKETDLIYGMFYLSTGPECVTHRERADKYGKEFLDSFELLN